jgi:hypothetical protein
MPFNCPEAPTSGCARNLHIAALPMGAKLVRCHSNAFPGNSFNPNIGKNWRVPEDGARFSPFTNKHSQNVPHLYSADNFAAAALESVFHAVEHVPSPEYLSSQLKAWSYTELELKRPLTVFDLINPNLRQLSVFGRSSSLLEGELIHTEADQYPNTRTWARYLHSQIATLHGLAWRPRLGGQGRAYIFFGDRCGSTDFAISKGPIPLDRGLGLAEIKSVAMLASIRIIDPNV